MTGLKLRAAYSASSAGLGSAVSSMAHSSAVMPNHISLNTVTLHG